jgi:hypothetical protein
MSTPGRCLVEDSQDLGAAIQLALPNFSQFLIFTTDADHRTART